VLLGLQQAPLAAALWSWWWREVVKCQVATAPTALRLTLSRSAAAMTGAMHHVTVHPWLYARQGDRGLHHWC
jgi:hypothetical protein